MKFFPASALALALTMLAVPASAATVIETTLPQADAAFGESGNAASDMTLSSVGPQLPAAQNDPVTILGNTLTSYASLLPAPSDWLLLVTGFGVIGYAMRSRKRGRVSFN